MSSIAELLIPVSTAQPCGEDISFSSEVDEIVRARVQDDPSLDQGEWSTELREADWLFVATRCATLIGGRSKDLRLAAWLAEALARTRGLRGLGDGYALLAGLCERYWDGLYPLADEDGHEQRAGNLAWLLARTPQLVREMPVSEEGRVCLADFEAARKRAAAGGQPAEPGAWPAAPAAGDNMPTLAELDAARRRNSPAFNDALLADARHCLAALQELEQVLDARLGADGPAFGAAREAVRQALDFIEPLATVQGPAGGPAAADEPSAPSMPAGLAGAPHSRAQALAQLRQVAAFFRRTEPHSPVAYLAEKAAGWGELPLHLWLRAVLKDQDAATRMDELLGVSSLQE